MYDEKTFTPSDFAGVYKELAEILGTETVIQLHQVFKGQQVTFPKRLYSVEYVRRHLKEEKSQGNLKKAALELDYTERRIRQILKE